MDRHAAKGSHTGQNDVTTSQTPQPVTSGLTPPFSETYAAPPVGSHHQAQSQYLSPQDPSHSPYTPVSNPTPSGITNNYSMDTTSRNPSSHPTVNTQASGPSQITPQTNFASYNGTMATPPGSGQSQIYHGQLQHNLPTQSTTSFTSHSHPLQLDMSHMPHMSHAAQYPTESRVATSQAPAQQYSGTESSEYHDTTHHSADLIALDQMAMPSVGPVFGDDGGLNKSPYIGMPEDFMAYLFNSLPTYGSPPGYGLQGPSSK